MQMRKPGLLLFILTQSLPVQNPNGVHNYFDHLMRQKPQSSGYGAWGQQAATVDAITGMAGIGSANPFFSSDPDVQRIVIVGARIKPEFYSLTNPDYDYWKVWNPNATIDAPIDLWKHFQNLVISTPRNPNLLKKVLPVGVILTGVDIFSEMMDRSGRGTPGLSDFPIP